MSILIDSVTPHTPAAKAGILAGDRLVAVNGNLIHDVLDYRFYMIDTALTVEVERDSKPLTFHIKKEEYDELGLEFTDYLMDRQHHCANKCVFCFVDQLPRGMRETLYFKDDDSRMSFLFGSYVTLTNMTDEDIARIIKMHISPINISVHATNPELRVELMKNPRSWPRTTSASMPKSLSAPASMTARSCAAACGIWVSTPRRCKASP